MNDLLQSLGTPRKTLGQQNVYIDNIARFPVRPQYMSTSASSAVFTISDILIDGSTTFPLFILLIIFLAMPQSIKRAMLPNVSEGDKLLSSHANNVF